MGYHWEKAGDNWPNSRGLFKIITASVLSGSGRSGLACGVRFPSSFTDLVLFLMISLPHSATQPTSPERLLHLSLLWVCFYGSQIQAESGNHHCKEQGHLPGSVSSPIGRESGHQSYMNNCRFLMEPSWWHHSHLRSLSPLESVLADHLAT